MTLRELNFMLKYTILKEIMDLAQHIYDFQIYLILIFTMDYKSFRMQF